MTLRSVASGAAGTCLGFLRGWAGLCVLGLGLVACSKGPPPTCPAVVRVTDADRIVRFVPGGRDLTDILFEASFRNITMTCAYDDDVLEAEMKVAILTIPGPANTDQKARIDYFVAIATLDQQVLAREAFALEIVFPSARKGLVATEEIAPRIPLKPGQSGEDFVVYVGLELTPDELLYNRENR